MTLPTHHQILRWNVCPGEVFADEAYARLPHPNLTRSLQLRDLHFATDCVASEEPCGAFRRQSLRLRCPHLDQNHQNLLLTLLFPLLHRFDYCESKSDGLRTIGMMSDADARWFLRNRNDLLAFDSIQQIRPAAAHGHASGRNDVQKITHPLRSRHISGRGPFRSPEQKAPAKSENIGTCPPLPVSFTAQTYATNRTFLAQYCFK